MKKIPTIFERDWDGDRSLVIDQINPEAAWVFEGEGYAHRKLDGTCCMARGGKLFKRREIKGSKGIPEGFEAASYDEHTDKHVGWVPVGDGPEDRWHREALTHGQRLDDGTYELVGPKVQGNPENCAQHMLFRHSDTMRYKEAPTEFEALKGWLDGKDIEGLVWHHPDGRMAKIKLRDFGFKRPQPEGSE